MERLAVYEDEIAFLIGSIQEEWRRVAEKRMAPQPACLEQETPATASAFYSYDGENFSRNFTFRLVPWCLLFGGGATAVVIMASSGKGWIIAGALALIPAAALYHAFVEQNRLVITPAACQITVVNIFGLHKIRYSFADVERFVVCHHDNNIVCWLYLRNASHQTKVKLLATKSGEQAKNVLSATGEIIGINALSILEHLFE